MSDRFYTTRELVPIVGHPRPRIAHACDTYRIDPWRRAGMVKLYHENQVPAIRSACNRVAERGRGVSSRA